MYGDRWVTINQHIDRTNRLKKADAQVRANNGGRNKDLGIPSMWTDHSRSGARWSSFENEGLVRSIQALLDQRNGRPLGCYELALIGWRIGRSANAVNEQAYKLLHGKGFFKMINTDY